VQEQKKGNNKFMQSKNVFARTYMTSTGQEVSAGIYNLLIGLVLAWGFYANWWMIQNIPIETIRAVNPFLFFGFYFISTFGGIFLFTTSSSPLLSFIGYNLVVVPFGMVINLIVSQYSPTLVMDAIEVTGMVTLMMMAAGTFFPGFFRQIYGALGIALISVIIVEVIQIFIFHKQYAIMDWIVAAIFCGYIGYDWGRANMIPKTVDNAIDSAAALYMDIINLFLRILRIMGRRK
jgi:FtsH-binding integral membrane protein